MKPALGRFFLGLRTAVYHTPDLAAATEWYATVLNQRPYFEEAYYVGFDVGGFELGLDPSAERPDGSAVRPGASPVVYWGVDDIRVAYERLLNLGAAAARAPEEVGPSLWVAEVADPFGNLLGLIENPHFGKAE